LQLCRRAWAIQERTLSRGTSTSPRSRYSWSAAPSLPANSSYRRHPHQRYAVTGSTIQERICKSAGQAVDGRCVDNMRQYRGALYVLDVQNRQTRRDCWTGVSNIARSRRAVTCWALERADGNAVVVESEGTTAVEGQGTREAYRFKSVYCAKLVLGISHVFCRRDVQILPTRHLHRHCFDRHP